MPDFQNFLTWFIVLACVLPLVILVVGGFFLFWFGKRWFEQIVEPDNAEMTRKLAQMKSSMPKASQQELIQRVIHEQAFKCGTIGAITGIGGFITLPLSLPVDLLLSARYQAAMVSFIAQTYGYEQELENRIATSLVMSGSSKVSQFSLQLLQKYAPAIAGKTFSKIVPFLGAVIGFAVNYAIARSMGTAAVKWYSSRSKAQIIQSASSGLPESS